MSELLAVLYPVSGQVLHVRGDLHAGPTRPGGPFAVGVDLAQDARGPGGELMPAGSILMIDPRCHVVGKEGLTRYNPRDYMTQMDRKFRRWLEKHPTWPAATERRDPP